MKSNFDEYLAPPPSRDWDVVVVGAGPAGAIAARESARLGLKTLLADRAKFPRYKVCGGCLNLRTLGVLQEVGLGGLPQSLGGSAIRQFKVAARGVCATLPLPGGMAVSRERLDAALVRSAIDEGAHFLSGWTATLGTSHPDRWIVDVRDRKESIALSARIVLASDGLGGRLMNGVGVESRPEKGSAIGIGAIFEEAPLWLEAGTIYMACGDGGYVGCTIVENGKLDVASALDPRFVREHSSIHEAIQSVWMDSDFDPLFATKDIPWKGTAPLTRRASQLSMHRCLVLGDAAGYVEPFTGEGIAWAVSAGAAVAPIAAESIGRFDHETEKMWAERYSAIVSETQGLCRAVASGLKRPMVRSAALHMLSVAPQLGRPFVRRLNTPIPISREGA